MLLGSGVIVRRGVPPLKTIIRFRLAFSRISQTSPSRSDGAPGRLESLQRALVRLTLRDVHPAHPGAKSGAFAKDGSSPDTTKAVALGADH